VRLSNVDESLLVILILAFFGGLPAWSYSREWGYGPRVSGLLLIIVIILLLTQTGLREGCCVLLTRK
jgi:hypothetical protein